MNCQLCKYREQMLASRPRSACRRRATTITSRASAPARAPPPSRSWRGAGTHRSSAHAPRATTMHHDHDHPHDHGHQPRSPPCTTTATRTPPPLPARRPPARPALAEAATDDARLHPRPGRDHAPLLRDHRGGGGPRRRCPPTSRRSRRASSTPAACRTSSPTSPSPTAPATPAAPRSPPARRSSATCAWSRPA